MFFADFLDSQRRPALLLAGECLAAAFVLHPVSGLFGLIGLLALLLIRAISKRGAVRVLGWAAGVGGAAALLGNLFLLLAQVLGRPRHRGALDIVAAFFVPGKPDPAWQPLIWGLALLGAGLLLAPPHRRALFRRGVGLFLWLLLALFAGYTALLSPDKMGIPLSLVAAVALGLELDIVLTLARRLMGSLGGLRLQPSVGLAAGLVALAIAGMTVVSPPLQANPGPAQEPEQLARALYRIKQEHQAYTWTVIGYQEALPQVLGRGYFLLWKVLLEQYDPVATIYNGVNPEVFVPGPKPEKFQDYPTCVAAARIFPLKDLETMIKGVAVAHKSIPNLKVIVFGSLKADPPYVQKCRDLIKELGLGPGEGDTSGDVGGDDVESWAFRFGGYHSQPSKIFTTGDISLLSSISEGFPFTVLESMSCGTPVVGTDVGGVKEALEGHGGVAPPRDPEAFGAGIVKLLSDDGLRQRLGRKCRETIIARFMTSTSVDGYRESYEKWAAYKHEHLDDIRAENAEIIASWEKEIEAIRVSSQKIGGGQIQRRPSRSVATYRGQAGYR